MAVVFAATLFDYNGVLVDDERVHLAAFQDVLSPLGIEVSEREYWDEYLGFDDEGAFEAILTARGRPVNTQLIAELVEAKKPRYLQRARHSLSGFDGAASLLLRQAERGPVVIVSGALRDEIELGLTVLGVREAVAGIVAAEDTHRSKPDPEGYQIGVKQLSALGVREPERVTVVFEDSIDGIKAALAAGLCCVGVAHSYPGERLREAGAHQVAENIAGISDVRLAELWQQWQRT